MLSFLHIINNENNLWPSPAHFQAPPPLAAHSCFSYYVVCPPSFYESVTCMLSRLWVRNTAGHSVFRGGIPWATITCHVVSSSPCGPGKWWHIGSSPPMIPVRIITRLSPIKFGWPGWAGGCNWPIVPCGLELSMWKGKNVMKLFEINRYFSMVVVVLRN